MTPCRTQHQGAYDPRQIAARIGGEPGFARQSGDRGRLAGAEFQHGGPVVRQQRGRGRGSVGDRRNIRLPRHPARSAAHGRPPPASGRRDARRGYRAGCTRPDRSVHPGRRSSRRRRWRRDPPGPAWRHCARRGRRRRTNNPPRHRRRRGIRTGRRAAGSRCRCRGRARGGRVAAGKGRERRLDQRLGVRARDQCGRRDSEIEAPELASADDQRERLTRRAPGDQGLEDRRYRPGGRDRAAGRTA